MIHQIYGLFDFRWTIGSITQFIEGTTPPQRTDQSQHGMRTRERNQTERSLETLSNSIKLINSAKQPLKIRMDRVNGIDMEFIFKKRGRSPETHRLRTLRNSILKLDKMSIVGKGRKNKRT